MDLRNQRRTENFREIEPGSQTAFDRFLSDLSYRRETARQNNPRIMPPRKSYPWQLPSEEFADRDPRDFNPNIFVQPIPGPRDSGTFVQPIPGLRGRHEFR